MNRRHFILNIAAAASTVTVGVAGVFLAKRVAGEERAGPFLIRDWDDWNTVMPSPRVAGIDYDGPNVCTSANIVNVAFMPRAYAYARWTGRATRRNWFFDAAVVIEGIDRRQILQSVDFIQNMLARGYLVGRKVRDGDSFWQAFDGRTIADLRRMKSPQLT